MHHCHNNDESRESSVSVPGTARARRGTQQWACGAPVFSVSAPSTKAIFAGRTRCHILRIGLTVNLRAKPSALAQGVRGEE